MCTAGSPHNPTDAELLAHCRSGQASAWKELVSRYGGLVYSVCRKAGLVDADAADVTQQTFCILLDNVDRLKPESRLGPWLATVARRHSWRVRARQKRETPEDPDALGERVEDVREGLPGSAGWEQLEWLHHGLSLLDERCRDLLTELYLRPESGAYEEVARLLGIAVGSIGPTRARCLERLRALMENEQ